MRDTFPNAKQQQVLPVTLLSRVTSLLFSVNDLRSQKCRLRVREKKWKTKQTVLSCSVNTCCGHAWKAACGLGVCPLSQEECREHRRGFTEELIKDMKWLYEEP